MPAPLLSERAHEATGDPRQDSGVLRFITAGSVDDGKSTLIGRLLHDTHQLLEDQLQAVEQASRKRGMVRTDLSLITDGLEAEREQGITIDVAYRYFATAKRKFIVADTPGHEQYTRNMATGASTAHAAVILAEATKGLLEQSKRHLYIAHLLGIRELVIAVNKMDRVGYERRAFDEVRAAFEAFADALEGNRPRLQFIPLSALEGDMVVDRGAHLNWYTGPTLLEALEAIEPAVSATALPFRFPVQLVQRTRERDRTYLGRIASGSVAPGQRVVILPAGVHTTVRAIFRGADQQSNADAGDAIALSLADEIDVSRGDVIVDAEHLPRTARSFNATLVWLATEPLQPGGRYLLKHNTRTLKAKIALVSHLVDVKTLEQRAPRGPIGVNSIVHAALTTQQPLSFDAYGVNRVMGAFILIEEATNHTVAAGMITPA